MFVFGHAELANRNITVVPVVLRHSIIVMSLTIVVDSGRRRVAVSLPTFPAQDRSLQPTLDLKSPPNNYVLTVVSRISWKIHWGNS